MDLTTLPYAEQRQENTMTKAKKVMFIAIVWLVIGVAIWSTQSTLVVSKPVAFVPVPMMCMFLAAGATVAIWRGKSKP